MQRKALYCISFIKLNNTLYTLYKNIRYNTLYKIFLYNT